MPQFANPDPALPSLTFMAQANAAGLTRNQVRQRVRSHSWQYVARGSYVPFLDDDLDEHARARVNHARRAVAAVIRNPGSVISDASAAVLHGVALHRLPDRVQLGVPTGRWTGTRSGIDFRTRDFTNDEFNASPVPVASALRSWIDITRFGTLADSLVSGDSALRLGLLPIEPEVRQVDIDLERWCSQWGARRLMRALPLLDGIRESPLESASFAYFVDNRIPLPSMQEEIRTEAGALVARVDFLWKREGIVGEADGRMKYDDASVLYEEKRREDAIRAQGYRVVRWGAGDLRGRKLATFLCSLLG